MTVLVVAASKYGATREIGEAIADELQASGIEARFADADAGPDLEGADAVVLGSAVYAGHWLDAARALLEGNHDVLAARPTWLFSSGPIGDPPKPDVGEPEGIAEAATAINARGHEVFAGRLDRDSLSRVERMLVRALRAPEGDFRDWEAIRAWAHGIAAELQG